MKRKRIVAKMLALSLVLSGLPMTSLHAAELPVTAEVQESGVDEIPANVLEPDVDNMEAVLVENGDSAGQEGEPKNALEESEAGAEKEDETVPGTDEAEENTSREEGKTDDAGQDELSDAAGKARHFDMSQNAKVAGTDGVLYEDVVYLSARNVMAMDSEMQDLYRNLCDEIASSRKSGLELQDVVFAMDANGDLYCSYYVPSIVLEEIQAELLPEANGVLVPDAVEEEKKDGETSDDSKGSAEEEEKDGETSDNSKDSAEEEKKDGETSDGSKGSAEEEEKDGETSDNSKDSAEEEKKDGETSDDSKGSAEEEKKDGENSDDSKGSAEEEKKDSVTSDDSKGSAEEEKKDGETSDVDKDAVEEEKKEEGLTDPDKDNAKEPEQDEEDTEEEELVIFEENMDELADPEEETFEVAEPVRIENTLDLGYGDDSSDELSRSGKTFYSVLPTEDYFVKQLSASQKKYYNAAKAKLTKGSNKFSFKESVNAPGVGDDVAHAVSALILAYPDKTDWMAKPGGFSGVSRYRLGDSVGDYTFTFDKSKFYSGALDSKAKTQVQTVGNLAIQYAAENYSDVPVYGIVKYFDQWVCENGYYEILGMVPLTGDAARDKALLGLNDSDLQKLYNIYYNCHSTFGILLEGYGVCESYAKTMSRLLDAVGIPNFYVTGWAGSGSDMEGHAWNYVQMPNGQWYLLDSTWNDTTNPEDKISLGTYLLVKSDGMHFASGCNYDGEDEVFGNFQFETLAATNYTPDGATESVSLSKTECNLSPKGKETLVGTINGKGGYSDAQGIWTSSNAKVAKVDQKGMVTAVAAGTAEITFSAAGASAKCTVNVDQIKAVKVAETGKTSETVSLGIGDVNMGVKDIALKVDMAVGSPHDAAWMIQNQKADQPVITCSKDGVATATATVAGNEIMVNVKAQNEGSTEIRVNFAGKIVKIKVSVGKVITSDMFDITWPEAVTGTEGNRTTPYTGKAIKPTVKKKTDDVYKPVTFKVSYVNNKDAGNAKAVITGTGKYGGMIELPFTITPIDITTADFSKELKGKVYNGGANPPATTVKWGKKALKAGKDYEILYTGSGVTDEPLSVVPVGDYKIKIRGTGNYTGVVSTEKNYKVTQNTIAKVSVAGSGSAKYTGIAQNPFTVKIGKNILPDTDYTITWYTGQGNTKSTTALKGSPIVKGKYTAVVTVKGDNLTTTATKEKIEKKFTIK